MVDKIRRPYSRWNNFSLSPAAKVTLINSSLVSIPTYNLLVYPIPDSVLSEITKVLRRFFWSHDYNGKGIHKVVRSSIIEVNHESLEILKHPDSPTTCLFDMHCKPSVHTSPSSWKTPVFNIASLGINYQFVNHFICGRDLPY
ncbi:uncharacterized protein LOC120276174 [Dioscorea cayenensis subsp. rotundata]|uniref:Uncharacterized protein LOC120276174 n=1 Tax=Dioscorea cayennensis subsp. rotundata TaxID=55577 RepID=A0AB40CHD7_DIOCR|nr:uncharacterized protein LOC120276174 [Dioscorea cayenensis subsp. rotundata]